MTKGPKDEDDDVVYLATTKNKNSLNLSAYVWSQPHNEVNAYIESNRNSIHEKIGNNS